MKVVLDASFMLDFLLPDEQSEGVMKTFKDYSLGKIQFITPHILPFEVVNGLNYAVKAERIDKQIAIILLKKFTDLEIVLLDVDFEGLLDLSLQKDLSIYDASYVYLSKQTSSPLLTLDKKLSKLASSN